MIVSLIVLFVSALANVAVLSGSVRTCRVAVLKMCALRHFNSVNSTNSDIALNYIIKSNKFAVSISLLN